MLVRFSPTRIAVCAICASVVLFIAFFGQAIIHFYFGSGNNFVARRNTFAVHFLDVGQGKVTLVQLPSNRAILLGEVSDFHTARVNDYVTRRIRGNFIDISAHQDITGANYRILFHTYTDTPIVTIEHSTYVFVLAGESNHATESRFTESQVAQQIFGGNRAQSLTTILQVGNHGAQTSTSPQFLDFIQPDIALISRWHFGTAHPTTIENLTRHNAQIITTPDTGNFAITRHGNRTSQYLGFRNAPNLWAVHLSALGLVFLLSFANLDYTKVAPACKKTFRSLAGRTAPNT